MHFNDTLILLTGPSTHNGKCISPTAVHQWRCCQFPICIPRILSSSWILAWRPRYKKKRSIPQRYCTIGLTDIEAWISFTWDDPTGNENSAKVFTKFENSFQTPNMQWLYGEGVYSLKQREDMTVEQLNIQWQIYYLNVATHETRWTTEISGNV